MQELLRTIPDVDVLLALPPEELGGKLLFLLRARFGDPSMQRAIFNPGDLAGEPWQYPHSENGYSRNKEQDVTLALHEAWGWLEGQGLIVNAGGFNGNNGFRVLSRRAKAFESESAIKDYAFARLLDREILHPALRENVWYNFIRGEFDVAVLLTFKAVEVAVRTKAGLGNGDYGKDLMRDAFHIDKGPLTDLKAERGERQAISDLFAGAIGLFKNPHSHRDVIIETAAEGVELILFGNHLLRIVDRIVTN